MSEQEQPIYSPFFGVMGATSAMVFSAMGAAYGWLRHRDCRRRGRPWYCTTTPIVCRNDPDPHFRRGPGSLWAYCGHLPIHEIRRISPMLHHQF